MILKNLRLSPDGDGGSGDSPSNTPPANQPANSPASPQAAPPPAAEAVRTGTRTEREIELERELEETKGTVKKREQEVSQLQQVVQQFGIPKADAGKNKKGGGTKLTFMEDDEEDENEQA